MANMLHTSDFRSRFNALHQLYRPAMLGVANDILKDCHLAEDAVQEAFLRIARSFGKLGEIDSPPTRSFVLTVVRNVSITMLNRQRKQVFLNMDALLSESIEWEDSVWRHMDYAEVLSAIAALPQIYREVLYPFYVDGYTMPEIGEHLGLDPETVRKRIQRGRRRLLDDLSDDE